MTSPSIQDMTVRAYADPATLGRAAGMHAAEVLIRALKNKENVRLMLAAAPSQELTLATLMATSGIDWSRIECFHMDDYLGLPVDAPQGFGNWLERVVFTRVAPRAFHRINPAGDPQEEASRYGLVMGGGSFDLVLCGLGVNNHLAFNDPPADFYDTQAARVIELDEISRRQQVDEGHFGTIQEVPLNAITVTIPRLLNSECIIASVPSRAKRAAAADTLDRPISGAHPGTALRMHTNSHLYLDADSDPR